MNEFKLDKELQMVKAKKIQRCFKKYRLRDQRRKWLKAAKEINKFLLHHIYKPGGIGVQLPKHHYMSLSIISKNLIKDQSKN